jgi:hypothetical protein
MNANLVVIRVGELNKAVEFLVYRELLPSILPYFRSAFKEDFKKAADRIIPLADVSDSIFRVFMQWTHA